MTQSKKEVRLVEQVLEKAKQLHKDGNLTLQTLADNIVAFELDGMIIQISKDPNIVWIGGSADTSNHPTTITVRKDEHTLCLRTGYDTFLLTIERKSRLLRLGIYFYSHRPLSLARQCACKNISEALSSLP